jgi:polysaccharide pyruvyl transferase CsaB
MKNILICGFYGNQNIGDEAMLSGMIKLLNQNIDSVSINVLSDDPQDTIRRFPVNSVHRQNRQYKNVLKRFLAFSKSDRFILGGGDLLRDTSTFSVASTWLEPLERAIHYQCKTLVLGVSVGEILRDETKKKIPKVLNKVGLIAVRDQQSKLKLEGLGVSKKIHVVSDLALENALEKRERFRRDDGELHVGISVRHLKNRGSGISLKTYTNLKYEMAKVIDYLVDRYKVKIHFIPFRTHSNSCHPIDDDYVSSLDFMRYSKNANSITLHRYFDSLDSLYELLGKLDLVIGMRLHSLILAAGMGVPVVALEYDAKVKSFMEEVQQQEKSISLNDFQATTMIHTLNAILDDPLSANRSIASGVDKYENSMVAFKTYLQGF